MIKLFSSRPLIPSPHPERRDNGTYTVAYPSRFPQPPKQQPVRNRSKARQSVAGINDSGTHTNGLIKLLRSGGISAFEPVFSGFRRTGRCPAPLSGRRIIHAAIYPASALANLFSVPPRRPDARRYRLRRSPSAGPSYVCRGGSIDSRRREPRRTPLLLKYPQPPAH